MKKSIIWISSILGFIVLIIILCFTLFGLNHISIDFRNQTSLFNSETKQQEIIESGEFVQGSCVLFMNEEKISEKIEKANPYIKVVNIEIIFPNNIIIHCFEREEIFAIQFDGLSYYICDEEQKILRILTLEMGNYVSTQTNAMIVSGYDEIDKNLSAGDFLSFDTDKDNALKKLSPAFKLNNRTTVEQKALIKEVKFELQASVIHKKYMIALRITDFTGFSAKIVDAEDFLEYKINIFLETVSLIEDADKETSELYIFQTLEGQFVAHQITTD